MIRTITQPENAGIAVFEDLRQAFREAVQNFKDEINRDQVPGTVDEILRAMVQETTDTQARLKKVSADLETARLRVQAEKEQVATMSRREGLAADIGDEETARVAGEYRARHQERLEVFTKKAAALEEEERLLSAEVAEMLARVKEARARRNSLTAEAGRSGARERLNESGDLFDAFKRMEARIEGEEFEADAAADMSEEYSDLQIDLDAPPPAPEVDFDAALAELKRRMGKTEE